MYTTSDQVYTAANTLTAHIGGFFYELARLIFEFLNTLIGCAMYAFDCVTSNHILLLVFALCFIYYVNRKYVHK